MTTLNLLSPLREVISRYDLRAKKALGQHFLCDLALTRRIAESAGDLAGCTVFEIGPGPGGLTRALAETEAKKVIAVEMDVRFAPALQEISEASGGKVELLLGDALRTDLVSLAQPPRAIVANLPYNIGTELLLHWLKQVEEFRSLTLMFQAEVVGRICAKPGSKAFGRLSVISQFCCDVERVLEVPASVFTPPPKVDSAVVRLVPRKNRPADIPLSALEKVTAAAFGQRRKMLRSAMKALGGEGLLIRAGIEPTERAENLTLEQFEALARAFLGGGEGQPSRD